MIPRNSITAWSQFVNWPNFDQVEQDLLLSRLIVEMANDPLLGNELVFRGGTCLHKFHLKPALRYSEDLDYVRRSSGEIGPIFDAVRSIGERLKMTVNTSLAEHPKVFLRGSYESGSGAIRIKIEINTHERSPAKPYVTRLYTVDSPWFQGKADVLTFCPEELVASKLRALYQRTKGRDLFDLWLALTRLKLVPEDIVACFAAYCPENYSARMAERNLREKLGKDSFRNDLSSLLTEVPQDYDIDSAGEMVINTLIGRIR